MRTRRSGAAAGAVVGEGVDGRCVGVADLLGGLERATAAKDGEAGEEPLLVVVEEIVAPGDRRPQCRVALVCIAASLSRVEPLTDPLEELLRAEELDPCGGELDRERKTVETTDQLVDSR